MIASGTGTGTSDIHRKGNTGRGNGQSDTQGQRKANNGTGAVHVSLLREHRVDRDLG